MGIVVYHDEQSRYAAEVVSAALRRSFTAAQIGSPVRYADAISAVETPPAAVLIDPPAAAAPLLRRLLAAGRKALALGRIECAVADLLGVGLEDGEPIDRPLALARVDLSRHHDESPAAIRYTEHALALASPLPTRALARFDFQNEWNNLGYGRIAADGDAWSLAVSARPNGCEPIAWLAGAGGERLYAALRDEPGGAALWFNRPVGPVDSGEWRVVEAFFADHRADELFSAPALREIPAGFAAAATMRLDCDESIRAARPLWEMYCDLRFPLSLAVLTGQSTTADDVRLLEEVSRRGGSLSAHSVTHAPNWGGSFEAAGREARESKAWLERHAPACAPVEFAVSPFHQNPLYAVRALAESGYVGFVGGIIANDPEFLLGRAGQVPFVDRPLVSHSAQCMLHGDCFKRYGDSIDAYAESFDNHARAGSIFGFLDHPFSARYQYGWPDESTRLDAHARLLAHIAKAGAVWRPNLADALRFLARRNAATLRVEGGSRLRWGENGNRHRAAGDPQGANGNRRGANGDAGSAEPPRLAAQWKGKTYVE